MGRREIDAQAREGEKAGRNSSQCRKKGKNSWSKAQKFTRQRNAGGADASSVLVSASWRNELFRSVRDVYANA